VGRTVYRGTVSDLPADRRRDPRAPIELKVEYKRLNSFFADYTRNISRGGTFIRTRRPLDVGTEFVFRLVVPRLSEPLDLRGRVQWIVKPDEIDDEREPGMGIGFIYESEADRDRIAGVVERLMVDSLGAVLYAKLLGHKGGEGGAQEGATGEGAEGAAPEPNKEASGRVIEPERGKSEVPATAAPVPAPASTEPELPELNPDDLEAEPDES